MFCPFCGNENRGGKKFCRQCGKQMPAPRARAMEAGIEAGVRDHGSGIGDRRFEVGKKENYLPAHNLNSPAQQPQMPAPDDPTAQLLHDTENFEISPAEPPHSSRQNAAPPSGNGSQGPSNGASPILSPRVMEMPAIPKIFLPDGPVLPDNPVLPSSEQMEEFRLDDTPQSIPIEPPPGANSGELTSTDELEVLDKTIEPPSLQRNAADASAERPAESFLQGDASGISAGESAKASRPFGFLSLYGSGNDSSLQRGLRVERLILAIAVLFAIVGLSIILWYLVLRSA